MADDHHDSNEEGNASSTTDVLPTTHANATSTSSRTTPSSHFLSPVVGHASRNYSVASDEDDNDDRFMNARHTNSNNNFPTNNDRNYAQAYDQDDLLDVLEHNALGTPLLLENSWDDEQITPMPIHHQQRPKLNGLNYLNVITYLLNVFVSYGIGNAGLFGLLPTRWQISKQFETLVTPAEWAYYLWVPILLFECIFALAQLHPNYRNRPIIQEGTSLYFFYTCVLQTAWTLFFAFELFVLSFVAVVLSLLSLASLLASQQYSLQRQRRHSRKSNLSEYWLFRFPFYIHAGWLIMCTVVQFSILFRYYTSNVGVQLAADIVSLGVMLPPSTFFLTGQPAGPDFVIPCVIIWSYISIAVELKHPAHHPKLLQLYGLDAMVAVRDASIFFAGIVILMLIPRVVIWMAQECCTITVLEVMGGDDSAENYEENALSPVILNGTPLPPPIRSGEDDEEDGYSPPIATNTTPSSSSNRRVSFYSRLQVVDDDEEENDN